MKKSIILIISAFLCGSLFSQISKGGNPYSWTSSKINPSTTKAISMPSFDIEKMLEEDKVTNLSKEAPYRFGKNFPVDLGLNDGTWTELANGDRIWSMIVESKDAYSLNFVFEDFHLPSGGKLFIFNEGRNYKIGAFTSDNNNKDNSLATYPLPGERIFIEYYEPKEVKGQSTFKIANITHAYIDIDIIAKGIGDSGSCNNNVICSVGDNWRDEINAVAMIVVGSNGICTGALVNNTANDGHPYFLTADHCTGGGVTNWVFRFNWQSPSCGDDNPAEGTVSYQTVSGSQMLAQGAAADYALLEINNGSPIPLAYNPYYAGWDASGVTPTSQVGIHHPAGDLKKISFDTDAAGTATYGGATTWRIFTWEDGTTEGGSSGSPLFDQNHRIIGQLYGGDASCTNNVNDYYGKFDVTYPNVCQWLAPGCNTTFIDGYDPNTPTNNIDLEVLNISGADQFSCSSTISPTVTIRNSGINPITSFTMNYGVNTSLNLSYNWTGILTAGNTTTLWLNPINGISDGTNTFDVNVVNPNGSTDQNPSNNTDHRTFITAGNANFNLTLNILSDNYPEETTWSLVHQNTGIIVDSGGPYVGDQSNFTENICVGEGCYDLVFYDAFGDGMQYQGVVGNYILTDAENNTLAEIVSGGNFGSEATHPFCIIASTLDADFQGNLTTVCAGETVSFVDMSTGLPSAWSWSFPGAFPSTSTDQNPTVTYNLDGVYEVTLIIDNGISQDTELKTAYITVASNTYYFDSDGDGYGDPAFTTLGCSTPIGYVDQSGDCEPFNNSAFPGAPGTMEDIDNDCNGVIEGDEIMPTACLGDLNNDNIVSIIDLSIILSEFGCTSSCPADITNDGAVTALDVSSFLNLFGTNCN